MSSRNEEQWCRLNFNTLPEVTRRSESALAVQAFEMQNTNCIMFGFIGQTLVCESAALQPWQLISNYCWGLINSDLVRFNPNIWHWVVLFFHVKQTRQAKLYLFSIFIFSFIHTSYFLLVLLLLLHANTGECRGGSAGDQLFCHRDGMIRISTEAASCGTIVYTVLKNETVRDLEANV